MLFKDNHDVNKTSLTVIIPQVRFSPIRIAFQKVVWKQETHIMPKKSGKKKDEPTEVDSDVDIISKTKIIFEDTKAITGVEHEFKWGEIY